MKVCIAEKPSVARDIARMLGATTNMDGYYEGNDYQVTWVFGHLCTLKEPHDYDPMWKSWMMETLPIIPSTFGIKLKSDKGVSKQFNLIKRLIDKAEYVVNCGDAGQEGELIQRWVLQYAKCKVPVYRLWISSLTDEAISQGFANLRPSSEYDSLYAAGALRAIGDWLLGMNATRAYSIKYSVPGTPLSIGRVQTPTLALVVARHKEIVNFKPELYWELKTQFCNTNFSCTKGKFKKKEDAEKVLQTVTGQPFTITKVDKKAGKELPPKLFDLTSLQVECNRRFGYTAELTLKCAQSLYEKKYTTYPRVDTRFLPEDVHPKIPQIMGGIQNYSLLTAPVLQKPIPKLKRIFDNSKITDHHAIIPTGVLATNMTHEEFNVYDIVTRCFIANFYPECQISTTTVEGESAQVEFKTSGKEIVDPGWRLVYSDDVKPANPSEDPNKEEGNTVIPAFTVGQNGPHNPSIVEKQTTPPKPYTEATLLRAMETAGKNVEDEELREAMKENGIGRPSTRAGIIETLFKREYMIRQRKNIIPTERGIKLIDTINQELIKSAELTGQWEKKLRLVEKKEYQSADFMAELKKMVCEVVDAVKRDVSMTKIAEARRDARTCVSDEQPPKEKKPRAPRKKKADDGSEPTAKKTVKRKKTETPTPTTLAECVCPICKRGRILKGRTAYGCSEYASGCNFRIPFFINNIAITDEDAVALLQGNAVRGVMLNTLLGVNG